MQTLDSAILKTIIYGDIFHFPMTTEEIHHFLICDQSVALSEIEQRLQSSSDLADLLCCDGTYYALMKRQELFALRKAREEMMLKLLTQVKRYGRLLAYFPFVELVGVTGALSMRNPSSDTDDLDYLVITRPKRVWLARAFIILLVRIMRLRNIEICPNYVLASDQLAQSRQDLYIAHEVAQMLPLSNMELYKQFREQNMWSQDHLPNATQPFYTLVESPLSKFGMALKRGLEMLFSTPLGDWLEQWEYRRKVRRFRIQADTPTASAEIDEGHVKGHFEDYGHYVLDCYREQLETYQLDIAPYELKSAGD